MVELTSGRRGIRNNNPGNIRLSGTTWQGQVPPDQQTDTDFVQFTDARWGIRAMARILNNYALRGINTVSGIISTWAPPTENKTAAYINAVADDLHVSPNAVVTDALKPSLIAAIIRHENGQQPYSMATIQAGVALV